MKIRQIVFLMLVLIFTVLSTVAAQEITSCLDFVDKQNGPGASPDCAPPKTTNALAFQVIKDLGMQKIDYEWYIMVPEKEVKKVSYKTKWQSLLVAVSSIQTLYDENADVFIVVAPKTQIELTKLKLGLYPQDKILAHAKYKIPDLRNLSKYKFPAGHFHKIYTLIVY